MVSKISIKDLTIERENFIDRGQQFSINLTEELPGDIVMMIVIIILISQSRSIVLLMVVDILQQPIINYSLLMEAEDQLDSDLQRSLDELDQEFPSGDSQLSQEASEEQSGESGDDSEVDEGKKKKEDDIKPHLKDKKSALDVLLPPDEDVDSNPPFVVVVQGSRSSGKSCLIRSLVKHFVKHKVDAINGTITLRSTKKQRITIIECPTDIRAMIDLSKIADIVLLVIDASLGFEMETFQFLSLLKCHGFPHVMGVLTHLDFFKDNKQLRKTKKKFKKKFEYEVGGNNKLFNISKCDNGTYPKLETAKIARYLGTSNPPKILWRLNHPYILVDRWQPAEDRNYQKHDDLDIEFYGYIRGSSYRMNSKLHFVGMGDYLIKQVEVIADPCPEYKKEEQDAEKGEGEEEEGEEGKGKGEDENGGSSDSEDGGNDKVKQAVTSEITKKKKKRRRLNQNQRLIYAPNCNLGALSFEHTSGFVTIPHEYVKFTRKEQNASDSEPQSEIEEGVQMVRDLQDMRETINEKLRKRDRDVELFEGMELDDDSEADKDAYNSEDFVRKKNQIKQMKEKTQDMLIPNPDDANANRREDLHYLIYESKQNMVTHDCSKFHPDPQPIDKEEMKNLFVTGMESDVLNEMSEEQDEEKEKEKQIAKLLKQNVKKAKISENTNFFQKGYYVKIVVEGMKYSNYLDITHSMPVLLTRINLGEDNLGFVKVNFRRHRWYTNLLKSNDPIIVSSGWRRYQSLITFATEDPNERMRFLKYTPHHDFCSAVFYGNFNQQNSGCIFTQTIKNDVKKFRIAGSGLIMEINKSFEIMKKVKLIGEPMKILKNTAFVKGMFNSRMEVANYIGAQIRTVSGIRGQIKKAVKEGGEGTFRATFEDKILMSDLIFCRAWYRMKIERFYNPVLNFGKNRLMKTKYELRIQNGVDIEKKGDSEYKNVDRVKQSFAPPMVPKKLQGKLPFKTAEKVKESKKDRIKRVENASVPKMLMSDRDREISSLIQRLNTIKNMKQDKNSEKLKEKGRIKAAMNRPKEEYYEQLKKEQKSLKMAALTRKNKREEKKTARSDK